MLPAATSERSQRESVKGKLGGRTHEIQRLIGRSLRGVVDTTVLGERTVTIDCDVLQADGGTRCASITGGWVALAIALRKAGHERALSSMGAVSVGIVEDTLLLDLDYSEDFGRGGRLQRGGHGCGHLRGGPGHRGGQALPPRPDGPAAGARRRRHRAAVRAPGRGPGPPASSGKRSAIDRRHLPRPTAGSCATRSRHKLDELRALLHLPDVKLLSPDDLGIPDEAVEDAKTFRGNAEIKARFYAERSGLPTLADDSGLEVDALGGRPGVYTRRYAGPDATDAQNNAKLLRELDGLPP